MPHASALRLAAAAAGAVLVLAATAPAAPDTAPRTAVPPAAATAGTAPAADTGATAQGARAAAFDNPVKSVKGADPWIEYHDGAYYMISTSWTSELTMRTSPTLEGLDDAPSIQVYTEDAPERCCNMWAPELHFMDGPDGPRWYIYYTAGTDHPDFHGQRIQVLESEGTDPLGPYEHRATLTDPADDIWHIDGSPLEIGGELYLLGSFWEGPTQNLSITPMSDPYTLSGPRTRLSTPTEDWERQGDPVQEGAVALYRGDDVFIVYSAGHCATPDYKLGMLTYRGGDPADPGNWEKSAGPVFQRDDAAGVFGPGHNGFFTSPDGTEDWIVYHGNDSAEGGCDNLRTARAQPFTWNEDGTPDFGTPVPLGEELPAPSGETAATPAGYTLVNRESGACLAAAGGGDGAPAALEACDGSHGQTWHAEDLGDDTSRLTSSSTGMVLDVADCETAPGTEVRQWSWLDNPCQRFRMVHTGGGEVLLENANSGLVVAAEGGGVVQAAPDAGGRHWSLEPVA